MKKTVFSLAFLLFAASLFAQKTYTDSLAAFRQNYVQTHEVVKGHDRDYLSFYPANPSYKVVANFKPSPSAKWIRFKTTGKEEQVYRAIGTASFQLNGKAAELTIYQSQDLLTMPQYKNYLFLPFTDSTSGNETYSVGRYIDLTTADIQNKKLEIDFNKAYNPYCAYVSGVYNCPIPPKENTLTIAVRAGEKAFVKSH